MTVTRMSTLNKIENYELQYNYLTSSELDDVFEKWADENCKSVIKAEDMMHSARELGGEKSRLGNMYEAQSDMISAMMDVAYGLSRTMNLADEFNLSDFIRGEGDFYSQCHKALIDSNPKRFLEQNKDNSFVDGWFNGFEIGIDNLLGTVCDCIDTWIDEKTDWDYESAMAYGEGN